MGLLAQANSYTMRICISLAITQMVVKNKSFESSDGACPSSNSTRTTNSEAGTYEWNEKLQVIMEHHMPIQRMITLEFFQISL